MTVPLATSSLLTLICAGIASAQTTAVRDSIDRFVQAELTRQRIPGISVAVLRGDSVILSRGYGFANVEQRIPATDSTVYMVGSLTKPVIAAAIVLLTQQGRLKLDDPITKYLAEGRAVWSGVTIRHLLTHTAGVPQDTLLDWSREYSESEMVRSAAQPLEFRPGTRQSYSSTGYALLGVIIHRVTGVPWDDFIRKHIFQGLEMRTAQVTADAERLPNRAVGYGLVNDTLRQNRDRVSRSVNSMADCCLSFSARDLARWAIGLNHARVIGRK